MPRGETDGIWTEELDIHSYDVDIAKKATMESLLKFFQEAAWNHAEHLGLGYSHLGLRGQLWMLSRLMVVVDSWPAWGQGVVVRTWPRGAKSLLALRDFELLDEDGRRLAGATSSWLVFDQNSRRPLRVEPILGSIRVFPERRSIGCDAAKLAVPESLAAPLVLQVKYSDLDLNDHVNNAAYVRWILDSYPLEFHRAHSLRSLAINFLAELGGDDSVEIRSADAGDLRMTHTIRRRSDAAESCRAELVWEE